MILENLKEFTIYEVEKLQDIFLNELKSDEDLVIDMQTIEKIDIVAIQLLLSLIKSAEASSKKVKLTNIGDAVLQEIKILHCDKALGL